MLRSAALSTSLAARLRTMTSSRGTCSAAAPRALERSSPASSGAAAELVAKSAGICATDWCVPPAYVAHLHCRFHAAPPRMLAGCQSSAVQLLLDGSKRCASGGAGRPPVDTPRSFASFATGNRQREPLRLHGGGCKILHETLWHVCIQVQSGTRVGAARVRLRERSSLLAVC